jgi:hypothetical protein
MGRDCFKGARPLSNAAVRAKIRTEKFLLTLAIY